MLGFGVLSETKQKRLKIKRYLAFGVLSKTK